MNAPEMLHAYLSCSSSKRWLNCTAAPSMEAAFPDERSEFAALGTTAHELGERALVSGRHANEISGDYPQDMREFVQEYLDYVRAIPGELLVEQRLSIEEFVPGGFGTSDSVILDDGVCHIVDYKHGTGVAVYPENNTQLMLYALGAYSAYEPIYGPINTFHLHIVQPRIGNISAWEISCNELLAFGEHVRPLAMLAMSGKGEAKSGEWCTFCRARHTCRARAETNLAIAKDEMGEWMPPAANLSDVELAGIYPKLDGLVRWANDLQAYCLSRAEAGSKFSGLKLVEGRSVRKITDEEKVVALLRNLGHDDYEFMNQKLAGIGDLEKLLGKKEFTELLGDYVIKPSGKPALVVATDKRPELQPSHQAALAEMSNA